MEEGGIKEIEAHVKKVIETLEHSQVITLKALCFCGFKGERNSVLLELVKILGGKEISHSELTETFTYTFKDKAIKYSRIKPEYYRCVRKQIFKI